MNYIFFECEGVVKTDKSLKVFPRVPYEITDSEFYFLRSGWPAVYFDLNQPCERVETFSFKGNNYYFVKTLSGYTYSTCFKLDDKNINIVCNHNCAIFVDNEQVFESDKDLIFSHYESFKKVVLLFFAGEKEYLVALEKDKVVFAGELDEKNEGQDERLYLTRLKDCLNHGKVLHIREKTESFLVYMDDCDLNLKKEFVPHTFLDCVLAGNYKYANKLLSEDLCLQDENKLIDFFPEFDEYVDLGEGNFALLKFNTSSLKSKNSLSHPQKNTLAGIFTFEVQDKITNIISQS